MSSCYPSATIGLLFLCFTVITSGTTDPARLPEDISINCGSTVNSAAIINGREWIGDIQPTISSVFQIMGSSTSSTPINTKSTSTDLVPHNTARISRSKFQYTFKLNPGQIILRLHFNSDVYRGFKGLRDSFSVEAASFILLSNFSPSLTADAHGVNTFVKEFCFTILENQEQLDVIFSPTSGTPHDNTYAFINGIEIISVPEQISYFRGDLGTQIIGKSLVYIENNAALELVHRMSVGRDAAPAGDDFNDMLGMWEKVQKRNRILKDNVTWKKSVDVGFRYLVRIYFSESELKTAETDGLIFKVLINERVVDTNTEIVAGRRDGHGSLWYRDYKVVIKGRKQEEGKRALSISLQSNNEIMDRQRFLEGFEIYKLSNPDNSLASPNAIPTSMDSPSRIIKSLHSGFSRRNTIATIGTALLIMVDVILYKLQGIRKSSVVEDENKPLPKAERICRRFSLEEIRQATNNFSDAFLIGRGGFGKVYRGVIDNRKQTVAIKRCSVEGEREFLMEIETLSEVRHINLVSLVGYCNERREMILVYEYMALGTVADHLYKLPCDGNNCSVLTWKKWLNICIGAGRGIDYLHTGCLIIHRDVKTSNILLDENFIPKVSDFGLAKPQDMLNLQSHVNTKVKGTRGYLDPYYYRTGKLTTKSDIYAFGVVLLEVLCARPAVEPTLGEDAYYLHIWARNKINKGEIESIIAPKMREEVSPDSLKTFVGVAERCLHDDPKERPTMAQVVVQLEVALEQQDNRKLTVPNETLNTAAATQACPSEEGNVASSSREQRKEASSAAETPPSPLTKPPNIFEMNNNGYTAGINGTKEKQKPHKNLWRWTFWKKPKLSDIDFFGEEINLPRYDLATISTATNKFSSSNKIGRRAYGSVYQAVLPSGQRVAIKVISSDRLEEFKSEICLAHRLHHRNIITLLGYSINDKEQGMIVYELMENGSLDTFLFDGRHRLQWPQRFKIIMGIAKAVVHLHENSELTLIHRYINPSHILLDNEMNPKLSGFSFLRTHNHIDDTYSTRVRGTTGYIAPECYKTGKVTSKVDVYSFGVVVMEILNDLRIHEYAINGPNLIQHVWKLWNQGRAKDLVAWHLVSQHGGGEYSADEALRCMQVSLLCTQRCYSDRPEMSSVLQMLVGEDSSLQEKVKEAASRERKWNINGNFSNEKYSNSTATFEYDDTLER